MNKKKNKVTQNYEQNRPRNEKDIWLFKVIAAAGAIAAVLAFILSYRQHNDNLHGNAPRFTVK